MAGVLGLASSPASAAYGPPGAPHANPAVAVPLSGAVTTTTGTWATVVMGKNDGSFDLFWQLFRLDPSTGRLALVTPPGVADNGGLMVATQPRTGQTLVGFGASQGLKFSPLADSGNSGRSWSPGGLPAALFAAPSVVALGPAGTALALVGSTSTAGSAGQQVLRSRSGLTAWRPFVTTKALRATPAGGTCAIGTLEAVAFDPTGTPLVGTSCRRPDTPGVFVDSDRQWHLADIPVPSQLAGAAFATLRLGASSGLFLAVQRHRTDLLAAWAPSPNRPWAVSAPLRLAGAKDVVASGTGPGSTQFVVVRSGGELRALTVAGPGKPWRKLPRLPARTATIALSPSGQVDALAVDVKKLSVWRLGSSAGTERWTKGQTVTVPIAFGSSA